MKKQKTRVLKFSILIIISLFFLQTVVLAHSGGKDSSGGHKDKNNKSGLGSYHYHCGGREAHLHPNGVCPYASTSTKDNSSSSKSTTTKNNSSSNTSTSSEKSSTTSTSSSNKSNSSTSSSKSSTLSGTTKTQNDLKNTSAQPKVQENKIVEVTALQIKNKEKDMLKIGEKLILELNIEPIGVTDKTIIWISSDTSIATVNLSGEVEAKAEGNVRITAKSSNGKEDSIDIRIENPVIEVTEVNLDKKDIYLNEGEYVQITAILYPLNAADRTVKWESSDESIATVENGKVTAIKEGNVTITAISNNGVKGTCSINVKKIGNQIGNADKREDVKDKETSDSAAVTVILGIIGLLALGIATLGIGGAGLAIGLKNKGKH